MNKELYVTDIPTIFWKKYIDADYFDRKEMIATMPLIQSIIKMRNQTDIDQEMFEYCVRNYVQSYLDDLINVMEDKDENTK